MSYIKIATFSVDFYSRRGGTELFAFIKGQPISSAKPLPNALTGYTCFRYSGIDWSEIPRSDSPDDIIEDLDFERNWASNLKNGHRAATRLYDHVHALVARHYSTFSLYATTTKKGSPIYVFEDGDGSKQNHSSRFKSGSAQLAAWF